MGSINHIKTSTVASDPVNTYLVNPVDWNASHAYTLQDCVSISGNNTAGILTPISSGTCYLAGGNNITLSQNANSITISGGPLAVQATISQWPDLMPISTVVSTYYSGSTTTTNAASQSGYTFSIYFAPMVLQCPVAFSNVRMPISLSSVAGTGTVTQIYSIGFYSNNNSTLSLLDSICGGMYVSQNSISAITYSIWTASTGTNATNASGGFNFNASSITSTGGNFSAYLQGIKNLAFPLTQAATTYTAGNYWCAFAFASVSTSSNIWSNAGILQSAAVSSACILDMGVSTLSTLASLYGWGAISTTYTSVSNAATWFPMPSSVAVSNMNTTNSSGQRFHFPLLRNI